MQYDYKPNNWVVLKLKVQGIIQYRLLGGTSGGYLEGDSWRLNSGITSVEEDGNYLLFHGVSGSIYQCRKDSNVVRMNMAGMLASLQERYNAEVLDSSHDWLNFDWSNK